LWLILVELLLDLAILASVVWLALVGLS